MRLDNPSVVRRTYHRTLCFGGVRLHIPRRCHRPVVGGQRLQSPANRGCSPPLANRQPPTPLGKRWRVVRDGSSSHDFESIIQRTSLQGKSPKIPKRRIRKSRGKSDTAVWGHRGPLARRTSRNTLPTCERRELSQLTGRWAASGFRPLLVPKPMPCIRRAHIGGMDGLSWWEGKRRKSCCTEGGSMLPSCNHCPFHTEVQTAYQRVRR